MPLRTTLDIQGIEQTLEELARQAMDVNQATVEALKVGGSVLLNEMLVRVPRDTGNLAKNLVYTPPAMDGNYIFTVVGISKNADADTARYGAAQEYGTAKMAAQLYIRPALDNGFRKARIAMREKLMQLMRIK